MTIIRSVARFCHGFQRKANDRLCTSEFWAESPKSETTARLPPLEHAI